MGKNLGNATKHESQAIFDKQFRKETTWQRGDTKLTEVQPKVSGIEFHTILGLR